MKQRTRQELIDEIARLKEENANIKANFNSLLNTSKKLMKEIRS